MAKKNFAVRLISDDAELLEDLPPQLNNTIPDDSVSELSALDQAEEAELKELESIVEKGLTTFREVGAALLSIQEKKLYRSTHKNIRSYMADRFGLKRNRGYQLMWAARTVIELESDLDSLAHQTNNASERQNGADDRVILTAIPVGKAKNKAGKNKPVEPHDVDFTEERIPNIDSAVADQNLKTRSSSDNTILPQTESHASALAEVPRAKRAQIWTDVVGEARETGKPITAGKIRSKAEKAGISLNGKTRADRETTASELEQNADQQDLTDKIAQIMSQSQPDEVMILVKGSLLIREGIAASWAKLRGITEPIDPDFVDQLTLAEAVSLNVFNSKTV